MRAAGNSFIVRLRSRTFHYLSPMCHYALGSVLVRRRGICGKDSCNWGSGRRRRVYVTSARGGAGLEDAGRQEGVAAVRVQLERDFCSAETKDVRGVCV